jgi:hypothetical protein
MLAPKCFVADRAYAQGEQAPEGTRQNLGHRAWEGWVHAVSLWGKMCITAVGNLEVVVMIMESP